MSHPLSAEASRQSRLCFHCPKMCRHACPVAEAERKEAVTPWNKLAAVDMLRREQLSPDDDAAQVVFACSDCGQCKSFCKHGNEVPDVLHEARAAVVAAGRAPAGAQRVKEHLDAGEGPGGVALRPRMAAVVPEDQRWDKDAPAQTLLFPGCTTFAGAAAKRVGSLRARLAQEGEVATFAGPDTCCGLPLLSAGFPDALRELAKRVASHIGAARRVVTMDPGCTWALRVLYPRLGVHTAGEVLHYTEVPELMPKTRGPVEGPVIWHPPCYLNRRLGVRKAPREWIEAATGSPPLEAAAFQGEEAGCSGGGGGIPHTRPEVASTMATRLLEDLDEGAAIAGESAPPVVTACPSAARQLEKAAEPGRRVLDLLDLLAPAPS